MKRHLSFLASPELGGRYTFSAGNRIAARYLASQLEFFGFRGAIDGSFFQPVPFVTRETDFSHSTLAVGSGQTFTFGEDFLNFDFLGAPNSCDVNGELVFVGYGISNPENGYDDYKGLDTKGKIAVYLMSGTPRELNGKTIPDAARGVQAAAAHGCSGAVILPDVYWSNGWNQIKSIAAGRPRQRKLQLKTDSDDKDAARIPAVLASPKLATALLEHLKLSFETVRTQASAGDPVKPTGFGVTARLHVETKEYQEQAQNVVGILEGRDPELKKQFIVLSAHYDHLEASDKEIFPGADDDGSGTTAVLEIARAFAQGERPRRSVLVLFNTGEEMGLLGSNYFTENPPVKLEQIVADFNIDMIGRSRSPKDTNPEDAKLADLDSVYLIGPDKHSSELMQISEETNQDLTKLKIDYTYNNENDPSRLFYRSDHWNFAKRGIPVIFYFNGLHSDYHRSTDTVDKIDFEKMARVARLVYATSWRVANREQRLKIDKWNAAKPGIQIGEN
ncbi:MAG: M20/M25/M40 family metallo-hydrolase [Blastocatellia bacterium]|nr:M20/M25/M40 family metallo-hydrolase [Blastocatellia bacterium]